MATKRGDAWRARWVDEHGRRQCATFRYARDAEIYERQKKAEVEQIARGRRVGPPPKHFFAELCDYWITNRASQKRSGAHDDSIIRRHLRSAFGALVIRDLGTHAIDGFIRDRHHLDPKTVGSGLSGGLPPRARPSGLSKHRPKAQTATLHRLRLPLTSSHVCVALDDEGE